MACSRCGANRTVRQTPPPSVTRRPGTASSTAPSSGKSAREIITGVKYVPTRSR